MHQPMNFKGSSHNTGCQAISMAQFVQTHVGGKALLYKGYKYLKIPKDPCWKGVNIIEMQEVQEPMPSKSQYLWTFIEKRESAFHIFHNLKRRCTCSFVHVVMQRLTVDFMGSWYIGSWFSGSWFCGSWSHGRTQDALVGRENVNPPPTMFKPTVVQILM